MKFPTTLSTFVVTKARRPSYNLRVTFRRETTCTDVSVYPGSGEGDVHWCICVSRVRQRETCTDISAYPGSGKGDVYWCLCVSGVRRGCTDVSAYPGSGKWNRALISPRIRGHAGGGGDVHWCLRVSGVRRGEPCTDVSAYVGSGEGVLMYPRIRGQARGVVHWFLGVSGVRRGERALMSPRIRGQARETCTDISAYPGSGEGVVHWCLRVPVVGNFKGARTLWFYKRVLLRVTRLYRYFWDNGGLEYRGHVLTEHTMCKDFSGNHFRLVGG